MGNTNKVSFKIGEVEIALDSPLFVLAGPCVIESKDHCLDIANRLVDIGARSNVGIIFKASFDKANRSSLQSFRGPGVRAWKRVWRFSRRCAKKLTCLL
jgi:2-dehydro-3-deoxyphosphooctonate aldolase (KDO 8-P synthase)